MNWTEKTKIPKLDENGESDLLILSIVYDDKKFVCTGVYMDGSFYPFLGELEELYFDKTKVTAWMYAPQPFKLKINVQKETIPT